MTRSTIAGALDWAALYGRDRHRPQDRTTLRQAALEMRQRGLTPHDIAAAMRLSEPAVRDLLGQEASPHA